jgi:hypothetical protein
MLFAKAWLDELPMGGPESVAATGSKTFKYFLAM